MLTHLSKCKFIGFRAQKTQICCIEARFLPGSLLNSPARCLMMDPCAVWSLGRGSCGGLQTLLHVQPGISWSEVTTGNSPKGTAQRWVELLNLVPH